MTIRSYAIASLAGLAFIDVTLAGGDPHDVKAVRQDNDNASAKVEKSAAREPNDTRKILYYRNPMGLPDISPVPKKDWMGMDYIPVYEDEQTGGSGVTLSPEKIQRSGVKTERVEKQKLHSAVRAPGVARYDERSLRAVSLRADGFIEKLYVEETGAAVKAGQPLFRVYSPAMVSAQVDYRTAERDRIARGSDLTGATQKLRNLEIPQAVLEELKRTGEPVMSIDWPAPADGVAMMKNVIEGQMVRMGEEIIRIADLKTIWVIADVAERDIGLVAPGQMAKVHFKAYPSQAFAGRVTFILHELDSATRTAKVRIEIDNHDHRIKHEMYGDVEIATGSDEARIAVPNSSVIDSGTRQVVFVARGDGRFEPRPVTLGQRGDIYTEITSGVDAGEEIVVGANFLIDAESNLNSAISAMTGGAIAPPAHLESGGRP